MNDEQANDLLDENEYLRATLADLLVNVLEDVPKDLMSKHLIFAITEAESALSDISDIDHKETEE